MRLMFVVSPVLRLKPNLTSFKNAGEKICNSSITAFTGEEVSCC